MILGSLPVLKFICNVNSWTTVNNHNLFNNIASDGASDNYMFRRIMVAIIRLCSYKGELIQ